LLLFDKRRIKSECDSFGTRGNHGGFLGIPQTFALSNLDYFKENYPEEFWREQVQKAYESGKHKVREALEGQLEKKGKQLKQALNGKTAAEQAAADYFGKDFDADRLQKQNSVIYKAFTEPKYVLDSMCFIKVVRYET